MSEPNEYREWILETIDSLRSRKARPDLERICRMVRRRHGSDPDRTRTELEKLIREQTVLKVNYKGSISYRNAAKVQRKSRKKSESPARERSRHDPLSHNGDSAHSFTDPEEGEEDSEPSPDPHPHTPPSATNEPPSSPGGADGRLDSRATPGCDVGGEERASARRDRGGSGRRGPGGCPAPGLGHRTDGATSAADAGCGGAEPGRAAADTRVETCSGGVGGPLQPHGPKQAAPPKSKVRVGGGGGKAAGGPANPDLGDRLVASVRSLSASRAVAPAGGHAKPLGLKEVLGYLSSQERLSEEKLTRGKVRVVMEREVARGRLRRTRCGNITLPLWGLVVGDVRRAPRDTHTPRKDNEPMETASEEEEREENDEEEEDPRSSEEDGGLSPVAMTIQPELVEKTPQDVELLTEVKALDPSGVSVHEPLPRTLHPPAQGASLSNSNSTPFVEESAIIPDQLNMVAENQMQLNSFPQNSSSVNSSESKTEVGVSSCLLTPTASPRDSGMSEERGINGGVNSGGFMKSEEANGSPVDWTVSDVVNYFTAAGFPEQADAFRTQEIDGKSLLLMQRNDVLTGLSIKLGPALKIYERHVKVLQKTHFEEDDC